MKWILDCFKLIKPYDSFNPNFLDIKNNECWKQKALRTSLCLDNIALMWILGMNELKHS